MLALHVMQDFKGTEFRVRERILEDVLQMTATGFSLADPLSEFAVLMSFC